MAVSLLVIVASAIFILLLLISLAIFVKTHWFLGFIKGLTGFVFLSIAGMFLLLTLALFSYETSSNKDIQLATISFKKVGTQVYQTTIATAYGVEHRMLLNGDLWLASADTIQFKKVLNKYGVQNLIKLHSLSSRYIAFKDENELPKSEFTIPARFHEVIKPTLYLKTTEWLNQFNCCQTTRLETGFYPVSDGAIYSVYLNSQNSLKVKALNAVAKSNP